MIMVCLFYFSSHFFIEMANELEYNQLHFL